MANKLMLKCLFEDNELGHPFIWLLKNKTSCNSFVFAFWYLLLYVLIFESFIEVWLIGGKLHHL